MSTGTATGSVTFTDGEGKLVYVESGVALVSVTSPDGAVYSAQEDVAVGPVLESAPESVVAFVAPQRVDDNARPGESPATEMWMSRWDGWRFDGEHVVLQVSVGVQGPGVRIAAVSYQVTLHGHVELGPKLEKGPLLQYVEPLPPAAGPR